MSEENFPIIDGVQFTRREIILGSLGLAGLAIASSIAVHKLTSPDSGEKDNSEYVIENNLSSITDAWKNIPVKKSDGIFGFTYRPGQAEWYGLHAHDALDILLDLPIDVVRIGTYWNSIEHTQGKYDFSAFDKLADQIINKGKKLIVTVGMKAPGWPEYYVPSFYEKNIGNNLSLAADTLSSSEYERLFSGLMAYLQKAAEHVQQYKGMILKLQLENEPFVRAGNTGWQISEDMIGRELILLKEVQPDIPVSLSGFLQTSTRDYNAMKAGRSDNVDGILSVLNAHPGLIQDIDVDYYPIIPQQRITTARTRYLYLQKSTTRNWRRMYLENQLQHIESNTGIHINRGVSEIEAEPWEAKVINKYPSGIAPFSAKPEDIINNYNTMASLKNTSMFLFWGIEYMYSRYVQGDREYIYALQRILEES